MIKLPIAILLFGFIVGSSAFAAEEAGLKQCENLLGLDRGELVNNLHLVTATERPVALMTDDNDLDPTVLGPEAQELFEKLKRLVVGHEDVLLAIARAAQRAAIGANDPNRPIGAILLLGVTGAGKTLIAEALAEVINGDPSAKIEIPGGEVQADHETAKITGAPPGYIGHGATAPMVTNQKLQRVTSKKFKFNVVLLDEIEKGSGNFLKLLLGVLDKGKMTSGNNEIIDFSQSLIIMTANVGQEDIQKILNERNSGIGFLSGQQSSGPEDIAKRSQRIKISATNAAKKAFAPEFINRIDQIFVFEEHTRREALMVLNMNLAAAQRKNFFASKSAQVLFNVTPAAREFILSHGYEPEYGGRSVRRAITQLVVEPIMNLVGSKQLTNGDVVDVAVSADGSRLKFNKIATDLSNDQYFELYRKIYGDSVPEPLFHGQSPLFRSDNFSEFLVHLQKTNYDGTKLSMIQSFITNAPSVSDRQFLDLLKVVPTKMMWGIENSEQAIRQMKQEGFGQWTPMPLEPLTIYFYWHGMSRLKALSAANRQEMNNALGPMVNRTMAWLEKRPFTTEFKIEFLNFLKHMHQKVMNLPEPQSKN